MIKYNKLWETLKRKNISQNHLINHHNLSNGQLSRLRKNQVVYTSTIDKLCNVLECDITDIMEHIPDDNTFK